MNFLKIFPLFILICYPDLFEADSHESSDFVEENHLLTPGLDNTNNFILSLSNYTGWNDTTCRKMLNEVIDSVVRLDIKNRQEQFDTAAEMHVDETTVSRYLWSIYSSQWTQNIAKIIRSS